MSTAAAWRQHPALRAIPSHTWAVPEPVLPVPEELARVLPSGGLRPGNTIAVCDSVILLLCLAAPASSQGAWCAAIGFSTLGMVAAEELGIDLERFAVIPEPGLQWMTVTAALMDATSLVLLKPPSTASAHDLRRITARARERKVVLLVSGECEGADLRLRVSETQWRGLGQGHGHLRQRCLSISVEGRRMPRPKTTSLLVGGP